MNLPLTILIIALTRQSLACREIFHNKTRTGGYTFRYDYTKGRYTSYDTTVNNSTIVCSNVYSIGEIFYVYKERNYDQFLKITDSNLTTLQPNELDSFPTITKLYLSSIHIGRILPGAFTGLLRLQELYLDGNELVDISKGVFTSLQKLELLDLSKNKIVEIEKFALMGVSNLRKLYLQNNDIPRLEDDAFDKLNHLEYLDLSGNPLSKLPAQDSTNLDYLILRNTSLEIFDGLSNENMTMKVLNLTSSRINSVDFAKFPNVDSLDLTNNRISSLKNCERFKGLVVNLKSNRIKFIENGFRKLTHLSLESNQLQVVNNSLLDQTKSILFVNLGDNNISKIEVDAFRNLTSLKFLGLHSNNLSKIDPILFRDLTSLSFLMLSYNKIEGFQYGTFSNLKSLAFLDISHNKLLNLHPYNFYSLRDLQVLYFDYNRINSFDVKDLTSHLNSILTISLNGNPWKCKELIQMSHILKNMSVDIKEGQSFDVENFNGIACENDNNRLVVNASGMSAEEFRVMWNESLKNQNVQLRRLFDEDFENSSFVKFFKENYNRTGFVKFLNDYKIADKNDSVGVADEPVQAGVRSGQAAGGNSNGVLILGVFLQFVICALLVAVVYLMFSSMRRGKEKKGMDRVSQVELCSDY